MANLGTNATAASQTVFDSQTTQQHELGAEFVDKWGRHYRYAKVGASTLVAGNALQGPAEVTTHQTMTPTAADIGAMTVSATLGITNAVTANQYAGGFLTIDTTPGNGYNYVIKSHPAAAASAACVFTLDEPLKVALTSSSRVSLTRNPYDGVIQAPATTLTGTPVGVAVFPGLTGEFVWIQTKGVAPVLISGTPAVGASVGLPAGTAGAVVVNAATLYDIGTLCHVGVTGLNKPVLINFA